MIIVPNGSEISKTPRISSTSLLTLCGARPKTMFDSLESMLRPRKVYTLRRVLGRTPHNVKGEVEEILGVLKIPDKEPFGFPA